jgi:hypothetical protein
MIEDEKVRRSAPQEHPEMDKAGTQDPALPDHCSPRFKTFPQTTHFGGSEAHAKVGEVG